MGKAKDRALELAGKIREAHRAAREAEKAAHTIGQEFAKLLPAIALEDEIERNTVEFQPGRYECNACHQPMLFTNAQRTLPPCDSCGRDAGYDGPPPKVLNTAPVVEWNFPNGLYECTRCRARVAVVGGTHELPPCEFCGNAEVRAV